MLLQDVAATVNPYRIADVFREVSGYLKSGDVDKLATHFASTVELRILATEKTCSGKQSSTIVKEFFLQHKPVDYVTLHVGSKASKHYSIGMLTTANGRFRVIVFLLIDERDSYTIQQLCIDHED
ncbi:MAG: DUF4783 domain-containing protein [Prevotellaceae bacterium]|nr:DUF4783 domain-containing protein [Prevotellaceae bacterium]